MARVRYMKIECIKTYQLFLVSFQATDDLLDNTIECKNAHFFDENGEKLNVTFNHCDCGCLKLDRCLTPEPEIEPCWCGKCSTPEKCTFPVRAVGRSAPPTPTGLPVSEDLEPNPNQGNESLDQDAFEEEEPLVRINVKEDILIDLNDLNRV
jgi:hypothetical protein